MKTFLWIAGFVGLLTTMGCASHEPEPHGGYYGQPEYHYGKYQSHQDHYYWRDGYLDDAGQYHYYKW